MNADWEGLPPREERESPAAVSTSFYKNGWDEAVFAVSAHNDAPFHPNGSLVSGEPGERALTTLWPSNGGG